MKKYIKQINLAILLLFVTGCTTTKHILKRTTEKIKVYKKSEILALYDLSKYRDDIALDADFFMGFSFSEELKKKEKNHYPQVAIAPGERPLHFKETDVNIDLCKHWKQTSFRETPLEEKAYGKNYSSFNPTQYKLFMSLEKLKRKNLLAIKASEQEDICIYIDREFSGHFGRFKDKSNKIYYKASEINVIREKLEKIALNQK